MTNKKIFSPLGLITIAFVLSLGVVYVFIQKTEKFEKFFGIEYPKMDYVPVVRIPKEEHRIGFITDTHAKYSRPAGDIKEESRLPMIKFVSQMNNDFKPEIAIDGGDFIEGSKRFGEKSIKDYTLFEKVFGKLSMPKYHLLGNHDLRGMTREQWIQLNNYENSYYYVDLSRLRVIFLDGDLIPSSSEISGFEEFEKQFNWLEELLKKSYRYRKIIFIHNSTLPEISITLSLEKLNRLNELFKKYYVMAVFSGHSEILDYKRNGFVNYFTIPGSYRSKYNKMKPDWYGTYAEITMKGSPSMKIFYKETENGEYKTMNIPSEEYYKAEQEQERTRNLNDEEEVEEETEE